MGRHLICLIDGTWVSADTSILNQTYSNIYKLGMLLANYSKVSGVREENIVFYSRGLGAQRTALTRYSAGGFAAGLEEEIADVYINLASNYLRGDKIYFFGFSRGAVIARAVAGLIGSVGLLKDRHINSYKNVWAAYRKNDKPGLPGKMFSGSPEIEFLGVFDTVFGGSRSDEKFHQRFGFRNYTVPESIRHAVHILSLDDRRFFFSPILWKEGSSEKTEQIWMPGVHSDIGGTYIDEFLGKVSLLAMIDRIRAKTVLGLYLKEIDALYDDVKKALALANPNIVVSNELESWIWRLSRRVHRTHDKSHVNQTVHPIVDEMRLKEVNYRRRELRNYTLHPSFADVARYSGFQFYPVPPIQDSPDMQEDEGVSLAV